MRYFTLGFRLPGILSVRLFGDRARFGNVICENDPCWQEWERVHEKAYLQTQKRSVGDRVNSAGYEVMQQVDVEGKRLLEIGPGEIGHLPKWQGRPAHVTLVDCREAWLRQASRQLRELDIPCTTHLVERANPILPFADGSFDILVSFYVLEHLYPLRPALVEQARVLRPGGVFVGAIPAEGGLAWGVGRSLTTRRWFLRNTRLNPDKIICWEHPNFACTILQEIDHFFTREHVSYWPLRVPLVDLNLVVRFLYRKPLLSGTP